MSVLCGSPAHIILLLLEALLQNVCSDAAKMKILGLMQHLEPLHLINILNRFQKLISDEIQISRCEHSTGEQELQVTTNAMLASLTILYILTSLDMHKSVYLEDVIDDVLMFVKYQLQNNIDGPWATKQIKTQRRETKTKVIPTLPHNLQVSVGLLAELVSIQVLTDMAVLNCSSIGIMSFFAHTVKEIQLPAVKLLTAIFMKYEKHRRFIFDDILASIAKQPSNKKDVQMYRLSSVEKIHMLSALVLHLIQSVPHLTAQDSENRCNNDGNFDTIITNQYKKSVAVTANFLSDFMDKCITRKGETDYRTLLENFIQDLLTTVIKPDWPGAMLLLIVLAKLLGSKVQNKSTDLPLRVIALEYLGIVIARMRRYASLSQKQLNEVDKIIQDIQVRNEKQNEGNNLKYEIKTDEEKLYYLQTVLLNYVVSNNCNDQFIRNARHCYITLWYHEISSQPQISLPLKDKLINGRSKDNSIVGRTGNNRLSEKNRITTGTGNKENYGVRKRKSNDKTVPEKLQLQKKFLTNEIWLNKENIGFSSANRTQNVYVNGASQELIVRFLISKGEFNRHFDTYLKHIFHVLAENVIPLRAKAMKSLMLIVEADPSVLSRSYVQSGVNYSFLDSSISVREAAVELVGKFVLKQPELIDKYYEMLSTRILDTGISVRKRVIKILKDICVECPEFSKIPEIWLKLLKRVNDEEGVRKLVISIFSEMWFKPIPDTPANSKIILRKVLNITDLVAASWSSGHECFHQLLQNMFKPQEDNSGSRRSTKDVPVDLLVASKQIISCLVENVLKQDESGSFQHLSACLKTLYMFGKIQPQLLVSYISTLQPYLTLRCQGDYQTIVCIIGLLKLTVPLMDHPSQIFLAQIEEDLVKLTLQHNETVVHSCISCLSIIVKNATHNFKLIRDFFLKFYGHLKDFKNCHQTNPTKPGLIQYHSYLQRAIFTVGVLMRHFDFTNKEIIEDLDENITNQFFEVLVYFLEHLNDDIQLYTLKAIGAICVRHYDFMLQPGLKTYYQHALRSDSIPLGIKIQVLRNIANFLQEEEQEIMEHEQNWKNISHKENLGESYYSSSGMGSTIIQIFQEQILGCYLHSSASVRQAVTRVIQLTLQQGLIQPIKIVPHLICLSTDVQKSVGQTALKLLKEVETELPTVIYAVVYPAIHFTYALQKLIQNKGSIVRGCEEEPPKALLSSVYSIIRKNKLNRRGLACFIIKQFEQENRCLSKMLFLSDSLAYFPYEVMDEPLFIIHHIDILLSTLGYDLIKDFEEALLKPLQDDHTMNQAEDGIKDKVEEEDEDNKESLLSRVPEDTSKLQKCIIAFQGCLLLIILKHHLKRMYGICNAKLLQYSPAEPSKHLEKSIGRKSNCIFNPAIIVQKLQQVDKSDTVHKETKQSLVEQYLEFKQLMLDMENQDDVIIHMQYSKDELDDGQCSTQASSTNLRKVSSASLRIQEVEGSPNRANRAVSSKRKKQQKSRVKIKKSRDYDSDSDFVV